MKYSDLISFNPIEDVIQLTTADDANRAKEYVKSYVMSDTMAANLKSPVLDQLQMDEVVDNKGVLVVGNYGTGKSHLMSVISSIAKDADNLQYLQNKNFAKEMECIAGKFEVLRIEIGGVTMSLREILFGFIEDDFAARGIDFEVPDFDTVRDNKKLIRDMMMAFSAKYPDKGYLIVVDEFLSYLTSRDERQIVLDLEFFRALGEMCSKSKLRVIFGVQEKIFDNPRFSFVSDTLKHVSDRFTQIVITKEATSYVVSERILKKTPEQKALIRKHLEKFSILYHKTLNVGRVQTPTLAMLVNRDYAISSFKKEKYHVVRLDVGGVAALSERQDDEAAARQMKAACEKSQAVCTSLKKEKKTAAPPKLFDLTALQREANRLYGFTAKQTLDYAQALYEKRLLTYPRTDSKYITSDMEGSTKELITGLCAALPFMQGVKLQADLARICDNSKVTDHHAILPTAEFVKTGFSSLAESEKKLMTLVCAKLLCAVAAPYEYEAVTAVFTCGGYTFTAKGRTTLCEGWREIERLSRAASGEQDEDAEPEAVLPPLAEGQTFDNPAAEISERYTQPPKAFTEDTLLSAMESAGKEDTPEDAERKGLGTTATRAGIIEKLISAGFAERKGKKLIPTKDGYNLVAILPDSLTSPQLTAEWETRLTGIAKGSDSPADFMRGIEEMTAGLVKTYSAISEDKAKLFTPQREAIGTCPRCGAAVYEGKKNFYCSDRACSFVMWKNDRFFEQRKKAFTKAIAAALLKDGKVKIKGMYSTKTGKTFDGVVLLADTGGKYVNFRVEQNRK